MTTETDIAHKPDTLPLEILHMEMVHYFCDYEIDDSCANKEYILHKVHNLVIIFTDI